MNLQELDKKELSGVNGGSLWPGTMSHVASISNTAQDYLGFVLGFVGGFADGLSDGLNPENCTEE